MAAEVADCAPCGVFAGAPPVELGCNPLLDVGLVGVVTEVVIDSAVSQTEFQNDISSVQCESSAIIAI